MRSILEAHNLIYIAGAHSRAQALKGMVSFLYPKMRVGAFFVDQKEENPDFIDGIPVYKRDDIFLGEFQWDSPVFIATKGIYFDVIKAQLVDMGFNNIVPMTVDRDNELRTIYIEKFYAVKERKFVMLEDLSLKQDTGVSATEGVGQKDNNEITAKIYMANSIYDKPITCDYQRPCYEEPIQVGTALTSQRIEGIKIFDNQGDNISHKNRQYCELTGMYWIWKNAKEDFVGLSHYRRHFILPEDWLQIMTLNHVDAILPMPAYVAPQIGENYRQRHDGDDWDYLLSILKEMYPKRYDFIEEFFQGNLYYPCNMFIMKKKALDDLCSWMFPILDKVAEFGGQKENVYANRYVGFVSERLSSLYFAMNEKELSIAHAYKNFLS